MRLPLSVPKVEAAGLGDLRTRLPATAPGVPRSMVAQGRPPVTRGRVRRTFTSREPFQKRALPFAQRGLRCMIALRTRYIEPKEWPRAVGVPWDFSGTSGCINGYERETAERPFLQVIDPRPPIAAGPGAPWSLPGHQICRTRRLRIERHQPSASHRYSRP